MSLADLSNIALNRYRNLSAGAQAYLNGGKTSATDAQIEAGRRWANSDPRRADKFINSSAFGGTSGSRQLASSNFRKAIENSTGTKWGSLDFNNAFGYNRASGASDRPMNTWSTQWLGYGATGDTSGRPVDKWATQSRDNRRMNEATMSQIQRAMVAAESAGAYNAKQRELIEKGFDPNSWHVKAWASDGDYGKLKYPKTEADNQIGMGNEAARQAGMSGEAAEQAGMGSEADKQAGMTDTPTASPGGDQAAGTTGDAATHDNEGAGDETYEIAEDVIDKSRGDNPEDWGYRLYEGGQYYYADDPDYAMEYALAKGLVDNYGGKYAGNFTGFQDNGTSDEWKSWVTEYNPQYYGYVYDQYGDPQGNLDWDAYWNDIINYDTSNYNDLASQDDFWTYNLAGSGSAAMDMAAVDYLSGNDILNSDYMWAINGQNMSGLDDAALATELQKLGLDDAEKAEELEKIMTEIEDEQAALYLSDLIRQQSELGMSPDQITTGELGLMQSELGPLELTLDDTGALLSTYEPVASAPEYGGTGYVGAYDVADLMSGEYVDPETLAYQSMLSGLDPSTLYYRS